MVYRASLIPDAAAALARWRRLFAERGENPIFVMAQTFDDVDPRPLGFDGADRVSAAQADQGTAAGRSTRWKSSTRRSRPTCSPMTT